MDLFFYHSVVQEAVATGNYKLVQMIIQKRDLQRHSVSLLNYIHTDHNLII
jgi:hypothetical protein